MAQGFRFPYSSLNNDPTTFMPRLPLALIFQGRAVEVVGLIDSGAAVNLIPLSVGRDLGADWEQQTVSVPLVGSLGKVEAKALIVQAVHPQLTPQHPVELIFAWAKDDHVPVLFGQTNFLMEFRVCFDASRATFEVYPKSIA